MARLWLKIKFWSKTTLVSAAVIYVLLFTGFNSSEPVKFWYWFGHAPTEPLLLLVVYAFFAGVIATILVWTSLTASWKKQQPSNVPASPQNGRVPGDLHPSSDPTSAQNGVSASARPIYRPDVRR